MSNNQMKSNLSRKIIATIIDYTLIFAFSFWYFFEFGTYNDHGSYTMAGFPLLLPVLVWTLYFVVAEKYCSATLGHEIVKLKVVSIDGEPLSFAQVLKRRLCDAIEITWCLGSVAFFIAQNNDKQQRLGGILGKTVVIDKNSVYEPVRNKRW